MLSISVSDLLW